jgi:hypothetical protein
VGVRRARLLRSELDTLGRPRPRPRPAAPRDARRRGAGRTRPCLGRAAQPRRLRRVLRAQPDRLPGTTEAADPPAPAQEPVSSASSRRPRISSVMARRPTAPRARRSGRPGCST